jgi:hypothetical protein
MARVGPGAICASAYGFQHSRDAVNFAPLGALAAAFVATAYPYGPPMTFGPGVDATVPGTRLYYSVPGGDLQCCDGLAITTVGGGPTRVQNYQLLYDDANDRLYVAYHNGGGLGDAFGLAYVDSAYAWTVLGATLATATGGGACALIPDGGANPGSPIVGWGNDSRFPGTRNVVQRWDGAAWQDELFVLSSQDVYCLSPFGDTVVLGVHVTAPAAQATPMIYQRAANGVWTDITPVGPGGWANDPALNGVNRGAEVATEFDGDLYVLFETDTLSRSEIWKLTVGGVWSLDLDLVAEGTAAVTSPTSLTVIGGALYAGLYDSPGFSAGYVLVKRGGVWGRQAITVGTSGADDAMYLIPAPGGSIEPDAGNCSGAVAAPVRVAGFWDGPQFVAWDPVTTAWSHPVGLWHATTTQIGSEVYLGNSFTDGVVPSGNDPCYCGEVEKLDPFVLTCQPPNGKGVSSVMVSNAHAPGPPPVADYFPLYLAGGYTFRCPVVTSVAASTGGINGGTTIVVTGTDFFPNLINPSLGAARARTTNRFFVRVKTGQRKIVEALKTSVQYISETEMRFTLPPYPGGRAADPLVEVIFQPAGLAPFSYAVVLPLFLQVQALPQGYLSGQTAFGSPGTIAPTYRCGYQYADYLYTGLGNLLILGSLETVLGLGGTGGDVLFPASGGGGGGGQAACPPAQTAGPCVR